MATCPETPRRRARSVNVLGAEATWERAQNGCIYVQSPRKLGPYPEKITERLEHWAKREPSKTFLAQRGEGGLWRTLSFRETLDKTRSIAQSLLRRRLSPDRPIAILSGNSLEHALIGLAAMYIGVPYAPIAPAYSIASRDHEALKSIFALLNPALVFADIAAKFEPALRAVQRHGMETVASDAPGSLATTAFQELVSEKATCQVDEAHSRVTADTIAKFLYTSGSTGHPKGVINTQRMLCSNQEMLRTVLGFLAEEPPILCDWLPWNHTFGGNHNFGITLYNGGALYIDEGKPAEGLFNTTLRNLREVAPTAYFNVPKGYEMLIPALRADAAFCEHFFSRLNILFYAAAGLNQSLWDELQDLAVAATGEEILMVTGLGATETAPFALSTTSEGAAAGRVGLPVPGVELKLSQVETKLEARLRGPNITPGYWKQSALTRDSFDEEGFYRMGDALLFADPADLLKGFVFDGRLTEDFKIASGTWVSVGPLRTRFLAHFLPLAQDIVITAPDRDFVGGLIFPNLEACRKLSEPPPNGDVEILLCSPALRMAFQNLLDSFAESATGSSTRVDRVLLMAEPPRLDLQEVTDKGTLNQKQVLRNRAHLVEQLYETEPSPRIISIQKGALT